MFPVHVTVDAARPVGEMRPIWGFFGADEPNYAYMKDGRKLLAELGRLGKHPVYFRAHNLLTTGDGTPALKWGSTNAYTEDAQGSPVYDWSITDRIFDAYRDAGITPLAQIGFMPEALSVKPVPYQHRWNATDPYSLIFTGWAYPPKYYGRWAELVYQWAKHCVGRYGKRAVEKWYWEVWNEPNIGYWQGTPEEFHRLHDFAIDAVRRALPTARVGGPHTAGGGGQSLRDFLEHCVRGTNHATGRTGTPLDYIGFHSKGRPEFVDGHVRMGIADQLRTIDRTFALIALFPELKDTPIIIGESDPDGCAACQGPHLGYRNGTMYSSYTAAAFARKFALADRHGVNLLGALTWAFEFEDQPYFAGFRVLSSNGIALPVLNVFRMLGKMAGGQRVAVTSSGEVPMETVISEGIRGDTSDVSALASVAENGTVGILLWHYHDDDVPGPDAHIKLRIDGLRDRAGGYCRVRSFRIDDEHSNAFAVWKGMGSPQEPTPEQYAELERAGNLTQAGKADRFPVTDDGQMSLESLLPRQGVMLVEIERRFRGAEIRQSRYGEQ